MLINEIYRSRFWDRFDFELYVKYLIKKSEKKSHEDTIKTFKRANERNDQH